MSIKESVRTLLNYLFRGNNLIYSKIRNGGVQISCGTNLSHCHIIVKKGGLLQIGERCELNGLHIHVAPDSKVIIGDNVVVNASKKTPTLMNAFGNSKILVGDGCLFSDSVQIHTTDYHSLLREGIRYNYPKDVIIGNHCWIGLSVVILKGVKLAKNTVVGAGSIISKSFEEENTIVTGNPASLVRSNIEWNIKNI